MKEKKRKVGRPKLPKAQIKNVMAIRLSNSEKRNYEECASEQGLKLPDCIRGLMTEHQRAIQGLKAKRHVIGDSYVDGRNGRFFVVVDGVAMSPGDAVRLNDGRVTLEELKHPDTKSR